MPKTHSFPRLIRWLILFAAVLVTGCSSVKYDIYEMMLNYEQKKAGLSSGTIEVNDKPIAFLESRRDKNMQTVVLIHGFAANKENWVRYARHLTDDYHVLAVDLPGHGESVKQFDLDYGIDDQVGYLHEILAAKDIERFHLSGNSMGGAISSLYAASYPDEVLSLTLINPAGIYDHKSELIKRLEAGEKNPLIVETPDDFERLMEFAMEKQPFIPWPIKSIFAEKAVANRAINEKIFTCIRDTDPDYDFKTECTKIRSPTLIIWGKKDRVIDVGNARVFAELIPGSQMRVFDDIGHAPMIEIPGTTADVFKAFISSANHSSSLTPSEGD